MADSTFSTGLRETTKDIWDAIFAHPFVNGIGRGDLSRARYEFYLKQDYAYLKEFSRVFALGSAKAGRLSDMGYFADLLQATLRVEMDLHRRTCADLGLSAESLESVEPAMITTAYTNLLIRTCYEGPLGDILAALLPCAKGYVDIAEHLKGRGLPSHQHYRAWIETYSSKEFADYAVWLQNRLDDFAVDAPQSDKDRWYALYLDSARFELLFFEMGWTMESWPACVPTTRS